MSRINTAVAHVAPRCPFAPLPTLGVDVTDGTNRQEQYSTDDFHSYPQPTGDELPKEDEKPVKPVDGYYGTLTLYRSDYAGSHGRGIKLHG